MGYLEGNLSGMDYTYGGAASHYPVWKPASSYFPRGEAPPPYEEAVAISQAEALSAQCTVSVATTTHRPVDLTGESRRSNQRQQTLLQQQQRPFAQLAQQEDICTAVGTTPHHREQQNQITQSTTNLINININSGGNVTTIATGENHQPPYSIQNEYNGPLLHMAQEHQYNQSVVSGCLNLPPSNSICVQTMSEPQQQQQIHLETSSTNNAAKLQPQTPDQLLKMPECSYKNYEELPSTAASLGCNYHTLGSANVVASDFELMASTQYSNHNNNTNDNILAVSTPLDVPITLGKISTISSNSVNVGLNTVASANINTLNLKNNTHSSGVSYKTPSSSRRCHRTIPRYFTASDPLRTIANSTASNSLPKSISTKRNAVIASQKTTNSAVGSGASNGIMAKKPTCQCPVQHVPMSYMGANQLNMNANVSNNVFLSTLSQKLNSSAATSSSRANNSYRSSLSYGHRSKPSTSEQYITEANPKRAAGNSSPYSSHEPKISTISKQVVDSTAAITIGEHHQHHHPHQSNGPLVVLSKVPNKFVQERPKSAGRTETNASIALTGKIDTFLNYTSRKHIDVIHHNPVLPPKLYKSMTNLKAVPTTANNKRVCISASPSASSSAHISSSPAATSQSNDLATCTSSANSSELVCSSRFCTEPKLANKATTTRKEEQKKTPPSLTLPPPSPTVAGVIISAELKANNKINSSTFYPLQNNQVTYTLPKHYSGKISLNSTIANVVSKVPSVISIPTADVQFDEKIGCSNGTHSNPSTCSTLPKILRVTKITQDAAVAKVVNVSHSSCGIPDYLQHYSSDLVTSRKNDPGNGTTSKSSLQKTLQHKHLPVCTTSKNCLNPKEHFLPNETSLDDDYLSECENCKVAQSSKYYLNTGIADPPQETMTLQRKAMDDNKAEQEHAYYRVSHTLPTNTKKTAPIDNKHNREPWFSTIAASSSSEDDVNE